MQQSRNWCVEISFWGLLLWGFMLCASCKDGSLDSPVPKNRVQYTCTVTLVNIYMEQGDPQIPLESPCGYVRCYDTKKRQANEYWGTGGLLLVQGFEVGHFYAYDLTCPYCYVTHATASSKIHHLEIDGDKSTVAICPTCRSAFGSIFWGSPVPTGGPAYEENYVLRQYKATLSGDDKLIVTN